MGAVSPTGPCDAGYFCKLNSVLARPEGVKTLNGSLLINGTVWVSATHLIGGDICPVAHYCPVNTSTPLLCPDGTYGPDQGAALCTPCPEGTYICFMTGTNYGDL